jgi:rhamnulokinase
MSLHIAIDLGASTGRVIVGDEEIFDVTHRFPTRWVAAGGNMFWDILDIFREIKAGLKLAFNRYGPAITSIGVDSFGGSYGLLDQSGSLLQNPFHYRDKRTDNIVDRLLERISRREFYWETGAQFIRAGTFFQLFVHAQGCPDTFRAAKHFLMLPDLLNYWLTGRIANEYTIASMSQLMSLENREWSRLLLARVGVPLEPFGQIVMPGTVLGELRPDVCDEIEAPRDTKVILAGCHDTACAFYAAERYLQKQGNQATAYISSGTWSLLGLITEGPIVNEAAFKYDLGNEGMVNGTNRFLKIITGMWLVEECRREWALEGVTYSNEELANLAEGAPHIESIVDVNADLFVAPGKPADKMTDRIKAFCGHHGVAVPTTHEEIMSTIVRSISAAYAEAIRHIEEASGVKIERVCVMGGGSRNRTLNRFTAQASGLPIVLGPSEATALGNIIVQIEATGESFRPDRLRMFHEREGR